MTEGKDSFLLGMKQNLLWLRILENFRKPGRECTLDPDQRSARDAKMTEVPRPSLKPNPTWPHARETCWGIQLLYYRQLFSKLFSPAQP